MKPPKKPHPTLYFAIYMQGQSNPFARVMTQAYADAEIAGSALRRIYHGARVCTYDPGFLPGEFVHIGCKLTTPPKFVQRELI